jgi:uridylate kinase
MNRNGGQPGTAVRRFLIKLSGETLGPHGGGVLPEMLRTAAGEIAAALSDGAQIAVVLGAGNLVRGRALTEAPIARSDADRMGMLATVMNGLAFRGALEEAGVGVHLATAFPVQSAGEPFDRRRVIAALEAGQVALLTGGTGHPFLTTDTAAALRALEIGADALLKATKVDGVYSADPVVDPDAVRYDHLAYDEVLAKSLGVMDLAAVALCRENGLPIIVFDGTVPGEIARVVRGERVGTIVGDLPDGQ